MKRKYRQFIAVQINDIKIVTIQLSCVERGRIFFVIDSSNLRIKIFNVNDTYYVFCFDVLNCIYSYYCKNFNFLQLNSKNTFIIEK